MMVALAVGVVALVGAGVGWALARFARALAPDDDLPLIEQKREVWK
jgi:hypothetical protein